MESRHGRIQRAEGWVFMAIQEMESAWGQKCDHRVGSRSRTQGIGMEGVKD